MDKYRKVENPREPSPPDEIRVTGNGHVKSYVTYTARLFNDSHNSVTIRATGNAVSIAVTVAEVVKRRFKGIHQLTTIGSTQLVTMYEPLEEGLDSLTETRTVSFISIKLARDSSAKSLDQSAAGYQEPLDESLVKELPPGEVSRTTAFRRKFRGRGGRGGTSRRGSVLRSRGGRRGFNGQSRYDQVDGGYHSATIPREEGLTDEMTDPKMRGGQRGGRGSYSSSLPVRRSGRARGRRSSRGRRGQTGGGREQMGGGREQMGGGREQMGGGRGQMGGGRGQMGGGRGQMGGGRGQMAAAAFPMDSHPANQGRAMGPQHPNYPAGLH